MELETVILSYIIKYNWLRAFLFVVCIAASDRLGLVGS